MDSTNKEILKLKQELEKSKETCKLINEMKRKYKMALFEFIRGDFLLYSQIFEDNSAKTDINENSYSTLCSFLNTLDYKKIEIDYEKGKKAFEKHNNS